MGRIFLDYYNHDNIYACQKCKTHLTCKRELISKFTIDQAFQGRSGKAYLFNKVKNVVSGPVEKRHLATGMHKVCDIFCVQCNTAVGWKYEFAYEPSQKYKEGKFIVEKFFMKKIDWKEEEEEMASIEEEE